jgi:hypothetical protein
VQGAGPTAAAAADAGGGQAGSSAGRLASPLDAGWRGGAGSRLL